MRLFLALKVPELNFKDERFTKLRANLDRMKMEPRFVPQEQLHIPLMELGDMGRGGFMNYLQKVKAVATDFHSFELKLSGLWGSPHQHDADMLWIGVQNSRTLRALQDELSRVLEIKDDELLGPHLPLVYLKRKRDVADVISPFKRFDFGCERISEIRIMEKLSGNLGVHMVGSVPLLHSDSSEANI